MDQRHPPKELGDRTDDNAHEKDIPIGVYGRADLAGWWWVDKLVTLLAQIDRPAGIVHSEGETWLTNAVTDKELGLTHKPPPDPSTM